MAAICKSIITNILTAIYTPAFFALLLAVLFMFVRKQNSGIEAAIKQWLTWFRKEKQFRREFLLVFYSALVLFRTLLNRNLWLNPLSNVMGVWGLYVEKDGKSVLTTEAPENVFMLIPFIILLFWCYRAYFTDKDGRLGFFRTLFISAGICFGISFTIEMLQLFLRLGTWQLSDLVQNTAGGIIGGLIYYSGHRLRGGNLVPDPINFL